jgi:hypothetical protein
MKLENICGLYDFKARKWIYSLIDFGLSEKFNESEKAHVI